MLQYFSIVIEVLIAILGLLIVFKKKKSYGWGIFLTFFIYAFYDSAKLINWHISLKILYTLFFIGTASAFWTVFNIYKEGKKKVSVQKLKKTKLKRRKK